MEEKNLEWNKGSKVKVKVKRDTSGTQGRWRERESEMMELKRYVIKNRVKEVRKRWERKE